MKAFPKRILIFLIFGGVFGASLWQAHESGFFRIDKIEVIAKDISPDSSSFQILKPRVEASLSSFLKQPVWRVKINEVVRQVKSEKWIKDVYVNRSLLGELKVWIRPQEVAALMVVSPRKIVPVSFEGSLLPTESNQSTPDVPFFRGKELLNELALRQRAIEILQNLPGEGELRRNTVSEMYYEEKEGFVLIMTGGGVKLYLGQKSSPERIDRVNQVLNYLRIHNKSVASLDARFRSKVLVREK